MNYYNEHDPKAAEWLRWLMGEGVISYGEIDERSICEVSPGELRGYRQCHFFAGIGGWSYALRLAGWRDEERVWTGSCPCQPFSAAGKGLAERDARHLWPELRRLIDECGPATVLGEQVASKLGRKWLAGVRADLESVDYAVGGADLCAAGAGAPHIRQRLWWVAFAGPFAAGIDHGSRGVMGAAEEIEARWEREEDVEFAGRGAIGGLGFTGGRRGGRDAGAVSGAEREGAGEREQAGGIGDEPLHANPWGAYDVLPCGDGRARRVEPGTFPLADGVPGRVGLLRGYGNAIVPEVAAGFIRAARGWKH